VLTSADGCDVHLHRPRTAPRGTQDL
jgi:hypothetical protein